MDTDMKVINGEASETDSDDDSQTIKAPNESNNKSSFISSSVITGEDSESDIDVSTRNIPEPTTVSPSQSQKSDVNARNLKIKDSLLHQKLRHNNTNVCKNINGFFITKISDANASLNNTNVQLMKSQLTLQTALNSLRTLNAASLSIKQKLFDVIDVASVPLMILNDLNEFKMAYIYAYLNYFAEQTAIRIGRIGERERICNKLL